MKTLCGADCSACAMKKACRGCIKTGGKPFGGECVAAECIKRGGTKSFEGFKAKLISEFNSLGIADMPEVMALFLLRGTYVNLEYQMPDGSRIKLLDDDRIYLCCQLEKAEGGRCYGLAADESHLLVCEYGCDGEKPEIIIYKKRS